MKANDMNKTTDSQADTSSARVVAELCGDPSIETEAKNACNMAAMREALEFVAHMYDDPCTTYDVVIAVQMARAALSEPPRNCDVGSDEEQAERFEDFCLKHIGCADETGGRHCLGCPLEKASNHITQKCELYWAQMPYKESEAEK